MPVNTNLFRTSTFRLAAFYLSVFALSVGSILAYIFWSTAGLLERQVDETIRSEVLGLADQYRIFGVRGVADVIQRRSLNDSEMLYLLVNDEGETVAGNLKRLPPGVTPAPGWIDFPITRSNKGNTINHKARGYYTTVANDYTVLVGRDVHELRQFSDAIRRTIYFATGLTILLGLGGGILTSRNFLRRVDAITGTSSSIMAGDLSQRMPIKGTNDELDRLSVSLNAMLDQIESLMNGMREMSSNVAHDLKTPLTRLRARVEAALRSDSKDDYRAALTQTIEESDKLLQTFNALLSIAQAEAGQTSHGMKVIDIKDVVEDVGELYAPLVEDADGTLTLDVESQLLVKADRQLIAQAVSNLIDNAIKYGRDAGGPNISLSGKNIGEKVIVSVTDKGIGIAEADRSRVTKRFARLDDSRHAPGNGLGLALVASVMKLHGGQLVLDDNKPGLSAALVLPKKVAAG